MLSIVQSDIILLSSGLSQESIALLYKLIYLSLDPASETQLLKSQIQLLQNEVLFERHKRDLYGKRNRRLLRGAINTLSLTEERDATV